MEEKLSYAVVEVEDVVFSSTWKMTFLLDDAEDEFSSTWNMTFLLLLQIVTLFHVSVLRSHLHIQYRCGSSLHIDSRPELQYQAHESS